MTAVLSHRAKTEIDEWLKKFPPNKKQSGVIHALKVVQEENQGFLTTELMDAVAAYLGVPNIAVYEVASFYSLFDLKPVGKHKISVCTNVSCTLLGCDKIMKHLKKKLNIELNETTADKRFTLKGVECLAACDIAPVMMIGKEYYAHLTPEKVDEILEGLES